MDSFKVSIPKPCSKNWNAMPENKNGRYCSSCEKTVVDFTAMEAEKIKTYLESKDEKICGRYLAKDVILKPTKIHQFLYTIQSKIEKNISMVLFKKSTLFLLGISMFIVGCRSKHEQLMGAYSNKSGKNQQHLPKI